MHSPTRGGHGPCRRRPRWTRRSLMLRPMSDVMPARQARSRCGRASPLTIVADGRSATLQPWSGDMFRTTHPSFRAFSLMFDRNGNAITAASWGPRPTSARKRRAASQVRSPLAKLAGPLRQRQPVVRHGPGRRTRREAVGRDRDSDDADRREPLARWRAIAGRPSAASFADFIDGRPQTFIFSGEKFLRHDVYGAALAAACRAR